MDIIGALIENLFSPPLLFFALGIIARLIKSDLELPGSTSKFLALYLITAIGIKGGFSLTHSGAFGMQALGLIVVGVLYSFIHPYIAFWILQRTTSVDRPTAAAIAAHYGSTSMATFAAATLFLKNHGVGYQSYCIAILALMEAPAIISGLLIAQGDSDTNNRRPRLSLSKIFTHGTILLLFGSFIIGALIKPAAYINLQGFLGAPFDGILCLFLLDMGLLVAKQTDSFKDFSLSLVLFSIYMPLIGAASGLAASYALGLDVGTATLFTVLCASSSYIAVPAALSWALPEARASIYLPMSLGITFPLSLVVGIPMCYFLASMIVGK